MTRPNALLYCVKVSSIDMVPSVIVSPQCLNERSQPSVFQFSCSRVISSKHEHWSGICWDRQVNTETLPVALQSCLPRPKLSRQWRVWRVHRAPGSGHTPQSSSGHTSTHGRCWGSGSSGQVNPLLCTSTCTPTRHHYTPLTTVGYTHLQNVHTRTC
jgi:hypothetical protein